MHLLINNLKKLKNFNYLTLILFILCFINCQDKNQNTKITIHNPEISLGNIPFQKYKKFYIRVKNDGNADLKISNIQPSCKCIVQGIKKMVIKPAMTDSIALKLNANSYGNFEESVVIISNTNPKFNVVKIHSETIK